MKLKVNTFADSDPQGGIVARFVVDDSSICFINCHLAAGQKHVRARNADIAGLLEEKEIFASSYSSFDPVEYAGGGDGSMVLDHEIVFVRVLADGGAPIADTSSSSTAI